MTTTQRRLDELFPYTPKLAQLQEAEALRNWAREMFKKYFRATPEMGIIHVYSFTSPGNIYTLKSSNKGPTCTCPGFTFKGDCRHSAVYRLAFGIIQPKKMRYYPWKAGHTVLMNWLYFFDIFENNPKTSRDILNLILKDGTMMKVQSLRSNLSELEHGLYVPLISHLPTKRPWLFYLNKEGINYVEERRKGKIDPIGDL